MNGHLPYHRRVEDCFCNHIKTTKVLSVLVKAGKKQQEMTFSITTPVPEIKKAISGKFVEWLGEEPVNGKHRKPPFVNRSHRTVRVVLAVA